MGRTRFLRFRRVLSTLGSIGALVIASGLAASCQAPTELTLAISTDARCGTEIKTTAIYVAQAPSNANDSVQARSPIAQTDTCASGTIGTLVVTPGGDDGAVVIIAGFDGKSPTDCVDGNYVDCIIARRSFSFIKHTPLTVPIVLERDCLNVPCDAFSTCHNGACYSSSLDCSSGSCSAVGSNDAGPVDAGPGSILQADGAPEIFPEAGPNDASSSADGSDGSNSGGNDAGDSGDAGLTNGGDGGIPTGLTCAPSINGPLVQGCGPVLGAACSEVMACKVTNGDVGASGDCEADMPPYGLANAALYCCQNSECGGGQCCGGGNNSSMHRSEPFFQCTPANGGIGHCQ